MQSYVDISDLTPSDCELLKCLPLTLRMLGAQYSNTGDIYMGTCTARIRSIDIIINTVEQLLRVWSCEPGGSR